MSILGKFFNSSPADNTVKPKKKSGLDGLMSFFKIKDFVFNEQDDTSGASDKYVETIFNYENAMMVYKNHPDVYACVREWEQTVLANGYSLLDKDGNNIKPELEKEIKDRFRGINNNTSLASLIQDTTKNLAITGNYYWNFTNIDNTELMDVIGLPSKDMRVQMTPYGEITGYVQVLNGELSKSNPKFTPDEVSQIKLSDPESVVYGMSPLEPIYYEVKLDIFARQNNLKYFVNDATPNTLFILDDGLGEAEAKKAAALIKKNFQGVNNKHRSATGMGIKDVKVISSTNKEMEFMEGRLFAVEKICASFGVPKGKIGYTKDVNRANGQEQNETFYNDTIAPLQQLIAEFINYQVFPKMGIENVEFEFNEASFRENEKVENSSREDLKVGILNINEARQLRGYEKLDEKEYGKAGDTHFIMTGAGPLLLTDLNEPMADNNEQANEALAELNNLLNEKKPSDSNDKGSNGEKRSE